MKPPQQLVCRLVGSSRKLNLQLRNLSTRNLAGIGSIGACFSDIVPWILTAAVRTCTIGEFLEQELDLGEMLTVLPYSNLV